MAFNEKETAIIEWGKKNGKTPEAIKSALVAYRTGGGSQPTPATAPPQEPSVLSRVVSDIPKDIKGAFGGAVNAVSKGMETADAVRARVASGETSPLAGTLQTVGAGLGAGAGVVGEGVLGVAKLPFTAKAQEAIGTGFGKAAEAVVQTRPAQELIAQYQSLSPETQRNIQGGVGVAEGVATMFGARPAISAIREAIDATTALGTRVAKPVAGAVADTASGVAAGTKNALGKASGAISPAVDVGVGLGTKVKDFATRTLGEAQDTAVQSRRLATLPEPEAKLIRSGADERVVSLVKDTTTGERKVLRELAEQARKKEADPTPNTSQPKEIAGRELLKPVDYLIEERNKIGSELGKARETLSTTNTLNINPAFREFQQYLTSNLGLRIDRNGKLIKGLGKIADSDLREIQKIYDDLRPDTVGTAMRSEKWVDDYLQRTFKEYDLRQAREKTFSDDVSRVAEKARQSLKQQMPEDYNALLTSYASVMKPLQDFVKLTGYKGDLEKLTAKELRAGEVALRVLGNASDRPQSVIDELITTAKARGYVSDVDLNKIIYLTDQLEDLYDITPTRGFSGSTARGVDQSGALGAASDIASLNVASLFNKAMSSKATREEVKKAFEEFLKSLD